MKVAIFGLFLIFNTALAAENYCTLEGLVTLCTQIPAGSQSHISVANGCYLQRPDTADKKILSESEKNKAKRRIKKQFSWVQEQMKKEILSGKSLQSLNQSQKSWYSRIANLKVISKDCDGNGLGGKYDATLHTVEICLNNGLMTEAQLVRLLAHEAGHSIDGCVSQFPLYQRVGHLNSSLPAPSPGSNSELAFRQLNQTDFFIADFKSKYSRPQDIEGMMSSWESRGLIKKIDSGISNDEFPFQAELSCLREQGYIKAGAERVKAGDDCRSGVVSETPSDLWGARIAGRYLKENSPQSDLEKLAILSDESIRLMCSERSGPKAPPPLDSPKWGRSKASSFRYLSDRYRDEVTVLSDRHVQEALGCRPLAEQKNCMQSFGASLSHFGRTTPEQTLEPGQNPTHRAP